jgi:diguanylate cyclase (GGDEF)-like protein
MMSIARGQSPGSAGARAAASRLVLAGGLLILATVIIAGLLMIEQRARALDEARQTTADLARVVAEQTSRSMQTIDLTLRDISARVAAMAAETGEPLADAMRSRAAFDLLVDQQKGLPQAAALILVGADGLVLNDTVGFIRPPLDVGSRDYFRHFSSIDDHNIFVGTPVESRTLMAWSIQLARRLNDSKGGFAGVVVAVIRLASMENFYEAAMPADSVITLLRTDGTVIVHMPHNDARIGTRLPAAAPWYRVVAQGGGHYRSPGYLDGIEYLVSVHPLRDYPLVVDVGTTQQAALAGWQRHVPWLVAVAALIAACGIWLMRLFDAHLRRLTESEASLASKNRELETSRLRFDAALDNMSQGLIFFDADQRLIVCNRRYREIYRLTEEQTRPGTLIDDLVALRAANDSVPDNMTRSEYVAQQVAQARSGVRLDMVRELRDGRAIALQYRPLPGGGWVLTNEDVTERRRAEADLAFMARHDALTRLPNRTLFQERVEQAIATARRQAGCALMLVDLDGFKVVNDTLGHRVGDGLLCAVATRLSGAVRTVDTVARLGGDEFAVVQAGLETPDHVAVLAERIIAAIGQPFDVDGHRITIGVSIGIAIVPSDGTSYETLLRNADIALYLAKSDGRGTYRLFEPEMDAQVQGRRRLELDLRDALSMDAFALHYQPFVDVKTGCIVGFEALIRWHHPVRGLVSPVDFIPIAEDTGLIVPIGRWVLRTACREAMSWPADVGLAVNLSAVQFRGGRLRDAVQDALAESGLPPDRLELEITESVLLQHSDDSLSLLHQLRAMGVRIALDDFGTGYSSLSYLRGFRFDKIKIDRSFVGDLGTDGDPRVIVGAVIGLAVGLGITITAEGVETVDQLAILREEGCAQVQGNLFSKPLPAVDVPDMLQHWRGRPQHRHDARVEPASGV